MNDERDDGLDDIRERTRAEEAHYDEVLLHKRYDDAIKVSNIHPIFQDILKNAIRRPV